MSVRKESGATPLETSEIALDGGNVETVTSPEKHIKTTSLIFLFGFFLIMINSVWDEWLPYGGYLFFAECLVFCAVVAAKNCRKLSIGRTR